MNIVDLLQGFPPELVTILLGEFRKIHQNYFLGKWDSSQLNGGRFGEVILRIIEYKDVGLFTPIGTSISRGTIISRARRNTGLASSLRLQVCSLTELIMDFRNNRNVAHPGLINPNEMDSTFVVQASNWIMAEIVRIEGQTSPEEARGIILKLIERKVPLIEEIGGRLKILNPKLIVKEQVLAICYQQYPKFIDENNLFSWVDEKNKTRFKKYLIKLDREKLLDYHDSKICLTKLGIVWVEKNIKFDLSLS